MLYGDVLRARRLVGLRGVGYMHDGYYYVKNVTHKIKKGEVQPVIHTCSRRTRFHNSGCDAMSIQRFYGKYHGTVTTNADEENRGRIRAKVPAVFDEEEAGWALPCVPYAGPGVGFFFIPPVDAHVWIEFEQGKSDKPIWTGCFWYLGEAPVLPALADTKIIKTKTATLKLDDLPGAEGITIETKSGLKIVMNVEGIELSNGAASVKLTPASVSVNNGALEVI